MRMNSIAKIWNERWRIEENNKFNLANMGIFVKDLQILVRKMLSKLRLPEKSKILDIGGATGRNLQFYFNDCNKNFEFFIVDISDEALRVAETKGFKTFCLDIETAQLPFSDNTFDIIIAQELIEHLYNPEMLVKEVSRTLKGGGFFLLTTPNIVSLHDRLRQGVYLPFKFFRSKKYIKFPFIHKITKTLGQHIVIIGRKQIEHY